MPTKKKLIVYIVIGLVFYCFNTVKAATIRNAIYLSYISGFNKVCDFVEDLGYDTEGVPIDLAYTFDTVLDCGFRIDIGLGPISYMYGDVTYYDIPIRATVGYMLPFRLFRPYIRAGLSYHFDHGDYVKDNAGLGFVGGVGLEIGKKDKFSFFIEALYDTAKATFKGKAIYFDEYYYYYYTVTKEEDIKVNGFMLNIGFIF